MGCWGITAFESDDGLDSVEFIRKNISSDGKLELGKIIEMMQRENYRLYEVTDGVSHSCPMALAEVIVKLTGQDFSDLDYDEEWAKNKSKFSSITSFPASKESLQWLRDYLSDTLKYAKESAEFFQNWGGWFKEIDWHGWQDHMLTLVSHLDTFLDSPGNQIELLKPQQQENGPVMDQTF